MKHLIFSDLHSHNYKEFSSYDEEGINSRLWDVIEVLDRIDNSAKKHEVDTVWFLGDLFHLKNNVDSKVIKLTMERMVSLSEYFTIYIIPGNHDLRSWTKDPTLLEVISQVAKVNIFVCDRENVMTNFITAPFTRKVKELEEWIDGLKTNPDKDIFLGHQYLKGTKFGSYEVTTDGLSPELLMRKFKMSFLGHCHTMFKLKNKDRDSRIISVGSPLQHNFGDEGSKRGWWILDDETWDLKYIKNSFSPRFITIKIKEDWDIEKVWENDEEAKFDKDFFRIKVIGRKIPKGLENIRWKRVTYELQDAGKKRSTISFSDKADDILDKYVSAKKGDLDKDKLLEIGRKFL